MRIDLVVPATSATYIDIGMGYMRPGAKGLLAFVDDMMEQPLSALITMLGLRHPSAPFSFLSRLPSRPNLYLRETVTLQQDISLKTP